MDYLISICIPTYNRCSILKNCLIYLVQQKGFDENIEVIISDNNSTDGTEEMIKNDFIFKYPNIKYFKNDVNIGMEKNIIKSLTLGSGHLLKLLNDYSILNEGTLEKWKIIVSENLNEKPILYFYQTKSNKEILFYTDFDSFFSKVTYWPTWIGSFSIWKNDIDSIENFLPFEGLLFPHLLLLIHTFREKKHLVVYNNDFFQVNTNEISKGGYNFFEIFIHNFIGNIIGKLKESGELSKATVYKIKREFINKFLYFWLETIDNKDNLFHTFDNSNRELIFKYLKDSPALYWIIFKIKIKKILNYKLLMSLFKE